MSTAAPLSLPHARVSNVAWITAALRTCFSIAGSAQSALFLIESLSVTASSAELSCVLPVVTVLEREFTSTRSGHHTPVMMWGPPVWQVANVTQIAARHKVPVIDIRLSQMEPSDCAVSVPGSVTCGMGGARQCCRMPCAMVWKAYCFLDEDHIGAAECFRGGLSADSGSASGCLSGSPGWRSSRPASVRGVACDIQHAGAAG